MQKTTTKNIFFACTLIRFGILLILRNYKRYRLLSKTVVGATVFAFLGFDFLAPPLNVKVYRIH